MMEALQSEDERKDLLLQQLHEGSTDTLTIWTSSDPDFHIDLLHALYSNESVKRIKFISSTKGGPSISDSEWATFLQAFNKTPALGFRVSHLTISDLRIPFLIIPTMLWQLRSLRELVLDGTEHASKWSRRQWAVLSDAVRNHPTLEAFSFLQSRATSLSQSVTNDSAVQSLATCRNLRHFRQEARDHGLSPSSLELTEQDRRTPFGGDGPVQLSLSSLVVLIGSKSLCALTYAGLGFRDCNDGRTSTGVRALWVRVGQALKTSNLTELSLPCNGICGHGIVEIAKGLRENPNVEKLDLSGNDIEDSGSIGALVEMLRVNSTIKYLSLSSCRLRYDSIIALADVFRVSSSLVRVDLDGNLNRTTWAFELLAKTVEPSSTIGIVQMESEFCSVSNPHGKKNPRKRLFESWR